MLKVVKKIQHMIKLVFWCCRMFRQAFVAERRRLQFVDMERRFFNDNRDF